MLNTPKKSIIIEKYEYQNVVETTKIQTGPYLRSTSLVV